MKKMLEELGLTEGQIFKALGEYRQDGEPFIFKFEGGRLLKYYDDRHRFEEAPGWMLLDIHEYPETIVTAPNLTGGQRDWLLFVYRHFKARWLTKDMCGTVCSWSKRPEKGLSVWTVTDCEFMTAYPYTPKSIGTLVSWEDDAPLDIEELLFFSGCGIAKESDRHER